MNQQQETDLLAFIETNKGKSKSFMIAIFDYETNVNIMGSGSAMELAFMEKCMSGYVTRMLQGPPPQSQSPIVLPNLSKLMRP